MTRAVVALGSNVGPRRATLEAAAAALGRLPRTRLLARSSWHATAPVGCPPGAPPFLNGAALLDTTLAPHALLDALQALERAHGRVRSVPGAARTLDLDLIAYGRRRVADARLVLPHPRAHERRFVLDPVVEVAPDLLHVTSGRSFRALRDALPGAAGAGLGVAP